MSIIKTPHALIKSEDCTRESIKEWVNKSFDKTEEQKENLEMASPTSKQDKRGHLSSNDDEDKKKKKKRKKRRKRKKLSDELPRYGYALAPTSRKPDVRTWAHSAAISNKEYYFDSHDDRDNLSFGSIYRIDVARYKLRNLRKTSELNYYRWDDKKTFKGDIDIDVLDNKLRS
ncbi:hypothetical protein FXO38_12125 [Capsicum annuum]|uniref:Uncharacterized protein n=1 Tax=Capsicum annuum TaxID=4072 RepID=A0A2G2ZN18_CAPAN|nr:hypothetical protein FXO38_12125 [Capsicum annuum]PHT83341.1 hypothetical protein T459_11784 [Capsicum annuum]